MLTSASCSYRPADAAVKPAADAAVSGKLTTANSKAKEVCTAASDYCGKCAAAGVQIKPGWYKTDLGRSSDSFETDGKDLENALRYAMGSTDGTKQYAAVKIGSGGDAEAAYWSSDNVFRGMSDRELDALAESERICASAPFTGGYPNEFTAGDHNTLTAQ